MPSPLLQAMEQSKPSASIVDYDYFTSIIKSVFFHIIQENKPKKGCSFKKRINTIEHFQNYNYTIKWKVI